MTSPQKTHRLSWRRGSQAARAPLRSRTAAGPRELKIEAPSTEDPDDDQAGSDEEHPEDRPLDRDELKRRAVKQLARREMGDGVSAVVDAKGPGAKKSAGKGPAKRR